MSFDWLRKIFAGTVDASSPSDWLSDDAFSYDQNTGLITVNINKLKVVLGQPPKVWYPGIPDSNSMDPVFDAGNNNILIMGANPANQKLLLDNLKVGDVAVYYVDPTQGAIHRIVKIDADANGRYFKFKGDNNYATDPYTMRDVNITWISIGTIY